MPDLGMATWLLDFHCCPDRRATQAPRDCTAVFRIAHLICINMNMAFTVQSHVRTHAFGIVRGFGCSSHNRDCRHMAQGASATDCM